MHYKIENKIEQMMANTSPQVKKQCWPWK